MKLDKLKIRGSKNLVDFNIDFDEKTLTTVIVGENGSGKSNLLEAIVKIFEHLDDTKNTPDFSYEIIYIIRKERVTVKFELGVTDIPSIFVTNEKEEKVVSGNFTERYKKTYLPNIIFGYYSGVSKRFENTFKPYQDAFEKDMREINSGIVENHGMPFRRFFFAKNHHSQYVLLSLLVDPSKKVKDFLHEELNIANLDSVLFVLKEPEWFKKEWRKQENREGDERFWYARGLVTDFLSKIFAVSLAPLFLPSRENPEHLYLYLHNPQTLENLVKEYGGLKESKTHKAFFGALDLAYIADLIDKVVIRVRLSNSNQIVAFEELSEGEQQLLTVLGLLRLTKEDESLFLLDEPDTHLNPLWSIRYLQILKDIGVVEENSSSHIIITTHNPMTISALGRKQVQIMSYDKKKSSTKAEVPFVDPVGRGIAGLLTSEIFGMTAPTDILTQRKLERRKELLLKHHKEGNLPSKELNELKELEEGLKNVVTSAFVQDPDYRLFIEAVSKYEEEEFGLGFDKLSPENVQKLREYALMEIRKIKNIGQ